MKLEEKLQEITRDHGINELIPVLAAFVAGLGVYGDIDPDKLTSFVAGIIRDTYRMNTAPPMKERN